MKQWGLHLNKRENKLKIVAFGLGPMGRQIARSILARKNMEIVGAIDIAREIIGKDLGEVLGLSERIGVQVTDKPEAIFSKVNSDIAVLATTSYLRKVYPDIVKCISSGMNVVSTCEELTYPYYKFPELASEIDKLSKKQGVSVLGTGINPGYLMDTLPIVLTGPCERVNRIEVTRMMYSGNRRSSFQKKIGTGLTIEVFNDMIKKGTITGHVGLVESIAMIAAALEWKLDNIRELPPEPIVADVAIETFEDVARQIPFLKIKPGQVCGLRSVAQGIRNEDNIITMNFVSHANVKEPYDEVVIEGNPKISERIKGGVQGDVGTVSVIINMIPKVVNAKPGLVTMKDLPLPCCVAAD